MRFKTFKNSPNAEPSQILLLIRHSLNKLWQIQLTNEMKTNEITFQLTGVEPSLVSLRLVFTDFMADQTTDGLRGNEADFDIVFSEFSVVSILIQYDAL